MPKDLKIRTKEFALAIIEFVSELPKSDTARIIGNQMLRSATSIGANFREAQRSRSDLEFSAKIGDCLKEAAETEYWLELVQESRIMKSEKTADHLREINEIIAILVTIHKKVKYSRL